MKPTLILLGATLMLAASCAPKPYPVPFAAICGPNPIDSYYADREEGDDNAGLIEALDRYERCVTEVYEDHTGESAELLLDRMYGTDRTF